MTTFKLNTEQRQRAQDLEEWCIDNPEEAAHSLIGYIDRLKQLEKALDGESRLHRKYWNRWHEAIRERDELERMLSFACKEWGEDIVNLRHKLPHK